MSSDLLLLLIGGLLVQPIGNWLQRGGRRARLRSELLGELEVLDKLDARPIHEKRVNDRVEQLLERYAPDPDRPRPLRDAATLVGVVGVVGLVLSTIGAVAVQATDSPRWLLFAVGGVIGIALNVLSDRIAARL